MIKNKKKNRKKIDLAGTQRFLTLNNFKLLKIFCSNFAQLLEYLWVIDSQFLLQITMVDIAYTLDRHTLLIISFSLVTQKILMWNLMIYNFDRDIVFKNVENGYNIQKLTFRNFLTFILTLNWNMGKTSILLLLFMK